MRSSTALTSKMNRPYDLIVVQPFTASSYSTSSMSIVSATDDPSVLGIKPIPNIQEKIQKMIAKYRADLEENVLFNDEIENTKSQL